MRALQSVPVALMLALVGGCGPRPEELLACKRLCEPMAWEVPRAGVCHCTSREYVREEADGGGDR